MSDPTQKRKAAQARAKQARLHEVLRDEHAFAAAISRYATAELILAGQRLEAEAEIKALMERHNAKIEKTQTELAELFEGIEDYARRFRKTLFKTESKTALVNGHVISFRNSPPAVSTTKGTTQKAVLLALLEHANAEWADTFVRWKESLNKEAILEQWNAETGDWKEQGQALAELGILIESSEAFILKTNRALGEAQTTKGEAKAEDAA
jgi:phage host-nuclease inhibitor protein Gam